MRKEPIFVLGCPRSGTTFLASLLSCTDYGRPFETHFITKYYKRLEEYDDIADRSNAYKLLNHVLHERAVMQWKLKIDPDHFFDKMETIEYRQIVYNLCMMRAANQGYEAWGDKTPAYLLDIDIINELFPDSKYIYIVRDGRDVALSLLKTSWGPNNIFRCAVRWKEYNRKRPILDKLRQEGKLFKLRYEDLLDDTERIVAELYSFLNQSYDELVVKELTARVKKGNYNKWRKKMNTRQVKLFENVAANTLSRFGYETSYEQIATSWLKSTTYGIHNNFRQALFLLNLNVIDEIKIRFFGKEPFAE